MKEKLYKAKLLIYFNDGTYQGLTVKFYTNQELRNRIEELFMFGRVESLVLDEIIVASQKFTKKKSTKKI